MDASLGQGFDVVVIGAGVAGCTAARELSRLDARVLVLEAGNDLACGATRANSGIVHAGFDPKPGSLKAKYNVAGAKLYPQWARELNLAYYPNGSFVCAFDDEQLEVVHQLVERGLENGVDVRFMEADEVRAMEPNVGAGLKGALYAPTGAICDPYDITLACAENAVDNGVEFAFCQRVCEISKVEGGFAVKTEAGEAFFARAVVNAAGVYADEMNNMVSDAKLSITPTRGDYCLYDQPYGNLFGATMFPTPTSKGKGVLVAHTIHGNLFVGPSSVPQESKECLATQPESLEQILRDAKAMWPECSTAGIITNFAGLRAKGSTGDFVIGPVEDAPGFFNIACFESPGLSSAPAVAVDIANWVREYLGCGLKADFNPNHGPRKLFAMMPEDERAAQIAADPAWGRLVCRCCNVTEGEIVAACHGKLPLLSMDALKWRCGAMMGRCHSGFCAPEIVHILCRELDCRPEDLDKRLPGSKVVAGSREGYAALAREDAARERAVADAGAGVGAGAAAAAGPGVADAYDVVVVGAGAAGLAAAKSACEAGAESVLVIDRAKAFGGIMNQCIHNGFGLHRYKDELTGPEYANRQMGELSALPVDFMMGASVTELCPGEVTVISPAGLRRIAAGAIVLATGSRERGIGAMNLPGDRPSGVYTAGSAQALMNLQGCLPGKTAIIMGSGDIGLIMARRMHFGGMKVIGMCERGGHAAGLQRNVVQCLDDFGIPLMLHKTVVRIEGKARLEAVWVADTDEAKVPIAGTEQRIECDTLVLSIGLIPENEVARGCGVKLGGRGGVEVDERCMSSVPGVFACGNNVQICGLADDASAQGDKAGAMAARWARGAAGEDAYTQASEGEED